MTQANEAQNEGQGQHKLVFRRKVSHLACISSELPTPCSYVWANKIVVVLVCGAFHLLYLCF